MYFMSMHHKWKRHIIYMKTIYMFFMPFLHFKIRNFCIYTLFHDFCSNSIEILWFWKFAMMDHGFSICGILNYMLYVCCVIPLELCIFMRSSACPMLYIVRSTCKVAKEKHNPLYIYPVLNKMHKIHYT
jgi:hypothetical protein